MLRRGLLLIAICSCRWSFEPVVGGDATGSGTIDAPHLVVDAPMLALDAGQCPPGYQFTGGSCYRVDHTVTAWLESELACEADAVGAHLVVIDDDAERTSLLAAPINLTQSTWIGTTKRQSPYRTVIDTAGFLALGTQTEPSEDCLSIPADGLMYLHTCGDKRELICEYDGIAAVPTAY